MCSVLPCQQLPGTRLALNHRAKLSTQEVLSTQHNGLAAGHAAHLTKTGSVCPGIAAPGILRAMAISRANFVDAARDALQHNPVGQRLVSTRVLNAQVVRRLSRKYFYPFVSRRLAAHDVTFLNWGYEEDPPVTLNLDAVDEPNRYNIHLYHSTATQADTDLTGKDVLEVSCGHGGGASYLMRTMKPAKYTGLDFNPDGIKYCRRKQTLPGLDFIQGDAEDLPFADESFDAVVNIEASHVYLKFPKFLSEVERVLRPGGRLLYADMRSSDEFSEWDAVIAASPLQVIEKRSISAEVLTGLEKTAHRNLEMVTKSLPVLLRPLGRQIVVGPGSPLYRRLQSGAISYRMYCFAKE
jgi:ubiquinone/menaquinone biosynthesis C-methylase UbiE